MDVSAVGANNNTNSVNGLQNDFRTRMENAMGPVAQLFGITPDDLMSAVKQSGGSLSDYAASKGVSQTDLINAIKQGVQSNEPPGVQLSDSQLTNIANRMASHKPGGHHHHHHGGGGGAVDPNQSATTSSTSAALNIMF